MKHDATHQADIERRLANLAKAPRCGARTRAGHPCKQAAVSGRARCRMHGGARGSGGPPGERNGNFKHGLWTYESIESRNAARLIIRETRARLQEINEMLKSNNTAQSCADAPTFSPADPRPTETKKRSRLRSASAVAHSTMTAGRASSACERAGCGKSARPVRPVRLLDVPHD